MARRSQSVLAAIHKLTGLPQVGELVQYTGYIGQRNRCDFAGRVTEIRRTTAIVRRERLLHANQSHEFMANIIQLVP